MRAADAPADYVLAALRPLWWLGPGARPRRGLVYPRGYGHVAWFAKLAGSPGVQVIDARTPGEFADVETFIAGERDQGLDLERSALVRWRPCPQP